MRRINNNNNEKIEAFKNSLSVGDKVEIERLTEDNKSKLKYGGVVTGMYSHIFTILSDRGYTESFQYKDYQIVKKK